MARNIVKNPYQILWLDDDYMEVLESEMALFDYKVHHVYHVNVAYNKLKSNQRFDLLLLDLMIPLHIDDAKLGFISKTTNDGTETGLIFYRNCHKIIKNSGMHVIVYSINKIDEHIKTAFSELGLPKTYILDNLANSNTNKLLNLIRKILN
jgi:hypothetical protein